MTYRFEDYAIQTGKLRDRPGCWASIEEFGSLIADGQVEQPIKAAWLALLQAQNIAPATLAEQQLAATVLAQSDEYWWSEVEAAMRLTLCLSCHGLLAMDRQIAARI
jgi:hypothetical protein